MKATKKTKSGSKSSATKSRSKKRSPIPIPQDKSTFISLCIIEINKLDKAIDKYQEKRESIHGKLINTRKKIDKQEQANFKELIDHFTNTIHELRDRKQHFFDLIQHHEKVIHGNKEREKLVQFNVVAGYTRIGISVFILIMSALFLFFSHERNWLVGYMLLGASLSAIGVNFKSLGKKIKELKAVRTGNKYFLEGEHKELYQIFFPDPGSDKPIPKEDK